VLAEGQDQNYGASSLPLSFETPSRPNQHNIFTTPAPLLFGQMPDWANDFDCSQFPSFDANPSAQFELPLQTAGLLDNPNTEDPAFPLPEVTIEGLGNSARIAGHNMSSSVDNSVAWPSEPPAAQPLAHAPSYADLHNAILRSLPPRSSRTGQVTSSGLQAVPAIVITPGMPVSPQMSLVNELPSRDYSMPPTPGMPPGFPMDAFPPPGHPSSHFHHVTYQPRQVLRQSNFVYDQVLFIHIMTKRWHWSLIGEDAFPINIVPARAACVMYAEEVLEISRPTHNITQRMFDYVSDLVLPH
jgi:hypothetical protein